MLFNGNHRLEAMKQLGQIVIPVKFYTLTEAFAFVGTDRIATFVEVSRLSGFYTGPAIPHANPDNIRAAAIRYMDNEFPDWR